MRKDSKFQLYIVGQIYNKKTKSVIYSQHSIQSSIYNKVQDS